MPGYGGYSIDLACRGKLGRLAYRCYNCACRLPHVYPTYRNASLHGHNFNARGVRSSVGTLFPSTHMTHVSLSAAHAHATCRHVVSSFRRNGASVLVNARVISGNLSFSRIDVINVLGTSAVLGCPSFHTCRHTFRLVTRITKHTKQGGGHNEIILRAGDVSRPVVPRIVTGSCRTVMNKRLTRHRVFRCPPCCHLICICLGGQGRALLSLVTRAVTTGLHAIFNGQMLKPSGPPMTHMRALFVQGVILGVRAGTPVTHTHRLLIRIRGRVITRSHFGSLVICCSMSPVWVAHGWEGVGGVLFIYLNGVYHSSSTRKIVGRLMRRTKHTSRFLVSSTNVLSCRRNRLPSDQVHTRTTHHKCGLARLSQPMHARSFCGFSLVVNVSSHGVSSLGSHTPSATR